MVQDTRLTDEQLVEQFLAGHRDSFEAIVMRYEQKVYSLAFRFAGNHEDARDLSQEAFIKVFRYLGQFKGKAAFSTWLYRIVTNVFLDEVRKRQRRPLVAVSLDEQIETEEGSMGRELPSHEDGPEDIFMQREAQQLVQQALRALPEDQRLILLLRDLQGYAYEEIGEILGLNLGTVKSRISRARLALRRELEKGNKIDKAGVL